MMVDRSTVKGKLQKQGKGLGGGKETQGGEEKEKKGWGREG